MGSISFIAPSIQAVTTGGQRPKHLAPLTAGVLETVRVRMVAPNLAPDRAAIAAQHGTDLRKRHTGDPHRLNAVAFLLG
jgi:hypothetical protein